MKAKFLWKRIPKTMKTDSQSELNRIWSISQYLIQRKYAQVFGFIGQLKSVNYEWSCAEIEKLINKLVEIPKDKYNKLINSVFYLFINYK